MTYLPWSVGEPNGKNTNEDCVKADPFAPIYYDYKCTDLFCFPCEFTEESVFRLKGLCTKQQFIDTDYILVLDTLYNGTYKFQGLLGKSYIVFKDRQWLLNSYSDLPTVGYSLGFSNSSKFFPLGTDTWYMKVDCDLTLNETKVFQLKLSKVKDSLHCIFSLFIIFFTQLQIFYPLIFYPKPKKTGTAIKLLR